MPRQLGPGLDSILNLRRSFKQPPRQGEPAPRALRGRTCRTSPDASRTSVKHRSQQQRGHSLQVSQSRPKGAHDPVVCARLHRSLPFLVSFSAVLYFAPSGHVLTRSSKDADGETSEACATWQHLQCMGLGDGAVPHIYQCDECSARTSRIRASRLQHRKENVHPPGALVAAAGAAPPPTSLSSSASARKAEKRARS